MGFGIGKVIAITIAQLQQTNSNDSQQNTPPPARGAIDKPLTFAEAIKMTENAENNEKKVEQNGKTNSSSWIA